MVLPLSMKTYDVDYITGIWEFLEGGPCHAGPGLGVCLNRPGEARGLCVSECANGRLVGLSTQERTYCKLVCGSVRSTQAFFKMIYILFIVLI